VLLPFFGIGIGAGLFTARFEQNIVGASGSAFQLSIFQRFLIAGRDFWFYLFKLFWPAKLTFIYPRWHINAASWWQYIFPLAAAVLLTLAWALRKTSRGLVAAALVFLALLFPALGFINVYPFVYSFVADHFQYLACVGPLTLLAAGMSSAVYLFPSGKTFARSAISGVLLLTLGLLSHLQCRDYHDIETLWQATIARNPDCWIAYNNLGALHFKQRQFDQAISCYERAVEIKPDLAEAQANLGNALFAKDDVYRAIGPYRAALEVRPNDVKTRNNLAICLVATGNVNEAIDEFTEALGLNPNSAQTHYNLGYTLSQLGRPTEAVPHLLEAIRLNPEYTQAREQLRKLGMPVPPL
jgi:tetratricopeptide (TPR) repeat protein